ncbi:LuxR C-terminal-related transcriptional regulator [Catenulispora yoronensis]
MVRAMVDLVSGRLGEAEAHLAAADVRLGQAPAERRGRLDAAVLSLRLSLARQRGDLAAVIRQAGYLAGAAIGAPARAPIGVTTEVPTRALTGVPTGAPTGMAGGPSAAPPSTPPQTLPRTPPRTQPAPPGADLRVVALLNLGAVEAFSLGSPDGERHLLQGAELARRIGRPYLEVACLAQLGFASKLPHFSRARERCQEAITAAEAYGWGTLPILAPALTTMACTLVWTGELSAADRQLRRARQALDGSGGPDIRTLFHLVDGMLQAARNRLPEALAAFATAEQAQARLTAPHALTGFVSGWVAATRARLGTPEAARAGLALIDRPLADSAEIRNAWAAVRLAEDDPAEALVRTAPVIDGAAAAIHVATVVEGHLLRALAYRRLAREDQARRAVGAALAHAEPDHLVLPFLLTGAGRLLGDMARRDLPSTPLVDDILAVVAPRPPSRPRLRHEPAVPGLSRAELRVLRYLDTNMSRAAIARDLSVSVNTVNTQMRHIYAKLQAGDRSTAVRRARELGLLTPGSMR